MADNNIILVAHVVTTNADFTSIEGLGFHLLHTYCGNGEVSLSNSEILLSTQPPSSPTPSSLCNLGARVKQQQQLLWQHPNVQTGFILRRR